MNLLSFRNLHVLIAICVALLCNLIFLGDEIFGQLLPFALVVLLISIFCRIVFIFSKRLFMILFWVFMILVVGGFVWSIISVGAFSIGSAGYITLGFLIFLAVLGTGGPEFLLFFSGSLSLLIGGIWLQNSVANFDLYLTFAIILGLILVVLSVYRIDIYKFVEMNTKRVTTGLKKFPLKGSFVNFGILFILQ